MGHGLLFSFTVFLRDYQLPCSPLPFSLLDLFGLLVSPNALFLAEFRRNLFFELPFLSPSQLN